MGIFDLNSLANVGDRPGVQKTKETFREIIRIRDRKLAGLGVVWRGVGKQKTATSVFSRPGTV